MAAQYKGILNIFQIHWPAAMYYVEHNSGSSCTSLLIGLSWALLELFFLCVQSHAKDSHKYFNNMHLGSFPFISNNCSSKVELSLELLSS